MQTITRRILTELSWLLLSFGVSFLAAIVLFGWTFVKSEAPVWLPVTALFFAVTFVIYLIKSVRKTSANTLAA